MRKALMNSKLRSSLLALAVAATLAGVVAAGAVSRPTHKEAETALVPPNYHPPGARKVAAPANRSSRSSRKALVATRAAVTPAFRVFERAKRASDRIGSNDPETRDSRRVVLPNQQQLVLYYTADGQLCVVSGIDGQAGGEACAPAETADVDPPVLQLSATDGSETYLFGAVPNDVEQVEVASDKDGTRSAPVRDNGFSLHVTGRVTDSKWIMRDGSRRDRP